MDDTTDLRRLGDLLVNPVETLDVEYKEWLDLRNDREHQASTARHLIALANHGGGYLVFGFREADDKRLGPAEPRPDTLEGFDSDRINGIVARYAEPVFHCESHIVKDETSGLEYPVVIVPGGHTVPIHSKADGPNGRIKTSSYYIRRPGPSSDTPRSGREWEDLIHRCTVNKGDQLVNAFRALLSGEALVAEAEATDEELLARWTDESLERWRERVSELEPQSPATFPHGYCAVSVAVLGDVNVVPLEELPTLVDESVVRFSGRPPFEVPRRREVGPYPHGGTVECWADPRESGYSDPARADFWRVSPDGKLFLIRGYMEDASGPDGSQPGTELGAITTVYTMGELLSFVASFAERVAGSSAQVLVSVRFSGLKGRELTLRRDPDNFSEEGYVSRQDTFEASGKVELERLKTNLPEVVHGLLKDLYLGFTFFPLHTRLVNDVIARMRGHRRV